jgi:hypothetical protein
MPKDYWTSEVQKATNSNNQNTLDQYMASLSDGVFVDRQVFIDAGGDVAVYDAYKKAYDDAQAKADEKTTKDQADAVIKNYIDAFGKLDGLDESWFGKSSMPKDYWTSEVQKATNSNNQNTLAQYMVSLSDGVFVDRQDFIDAGGNTAVYDAYKKAYDDAEAKGEAKDKATVATSALNTLIATNADVDWDSEEIQQLITDSGRNPLEWNALIAQMQEEAQAAADAEAMAKAEETILAHIQAGNGANTLDRDLVVDSGRSWDYWKNYEKIITSGEAEEVAEVYRVDYEDAANWMAKMDSATTYDEASRLAYTISTSTGNDEFAQSLLSRWTMKHGAAQG